MKARIAMLKRRWLIMWKRWLRARTLWAELDRELRAFRQREHDREWALQARTAALREEEAKKIPPD